MSNIRLKNEIIFLRHSKIMEEGKLFGTKDATASEISIKKKLF